MAIAFDALLDEDKVDEKKARSLMYVPCGLRQIATWLPPTAAAITAPGCFIFV